MTSRIGANTRIAAASERTRAALPRIADQLGVEIQPIPTWRDPIRQEAERAEWLATTLEAIVAAVETTPTPITSKRTPKTAA